MQIEPLKYLLHDNEGQLWWKSHLYLGILEQAELSLPWLTRAFAAQLLSWWLCSASDIEKFRAQC